MIRRKQEAAAGVGGGEEGKRKDVVDVEGPETVGGGRGGGAVDVGPLPEGWFAKRMGGVCECVCVCLCACVCV